MLASLVRVAQAHARLMAQRQAGVRDVPRRCFGCSSLSIIVSLDSVPIAYMPPALGSAARAKGGAVLRSRQRGAVHRRRPARGGEDEHVAASRGVVGSA